MTRAMVLTRNDALGAVEVAFAAGSTTIRSPMMTA
jgi:hypothetical protein